ncbi:hypothetical protein L7F22_022965 [Adiantum nelumboides]|nr:hypothetical protein [Adiantum nelumboides]
MLLCEGMLIHFLMIENGDDRDILVVNLVVEMYGKCKALHDARATFDKLEERNVFSWTIMIGAYGQNSLKREALQLFRSMEPAGVAPNKVTFITVVSVCASMQDLAEGKLIHSCIEASSFISDVRVGNALIFMYDNCGSIEEACLVFQKMPEHNVVTWNALIAAHAKHGQGRAALQLFHQMQLENALPDNVTFVNTLDLFATRSSLCECKWVHARIGVSARELDIVLGTTIVYAYGKCGSTVDALMLFDGMPHTCAILWNAVLGAHEEQEEDANVLQLYQQMLSESVIPDNVGYVVAFSACTSSQEGLREGKRLHASAIFSAFDWDLIFWNALINMYGKGGDLREAFSTLQEAPACDDASWNAVIAAHAQYSQEDKAIQFFQQMQMQCIIPNKLTFVSILDACATKTELAEGKRVHARIVSSGLEKDVVEFRSTDLNLIDKDVHQDSMSALNRAVGNALVSMYGKCRSLDYAWMVFDKMLTRDVISWTALIAAYAHEGQGDVAFRLFFQMQDEGVKPNKITYISILNAFSDRASLAEGQIVHFYLITIEFEIDMEVGNTAMIMYGNCGCLEDAQRVFDRMLKKNVISWTTLISIYSHYGMGKQAHKLYLEMQEAGVVPTPITFVSVLSACSHAGLFEEGCRCFDSLTQVYGLSPNVEHYNCMVDLFARAGKLEEGIRMIQRMPTSPTATTWMTLLGACKMHQNVERALFIAEKIFELEPKRATPYVLLYSIFSAAGRCEDAEHIKTVMVSKGLNKLLVGSPADKLSTEDETCLDISDVYTKQVAFMSI